MRAFRVIDLLLVLVCGWIPISCGDGPADMEADSGPKGGGVEGEEESSLEACQDKVDNDNDTYIDCDDQDCWALDICEGGGDGDTDADADGDTDADTDADTDTSGCGDLPALPRSDTFIEHFSPSEDFVFDKEGNILQVTSDGSTVVRKTTYEGSTEIITPISNNWPQGTRLLPNGELIVTQAESHQLIRIYPNGSYETFASGVASPNGIAVDMQGILYVTSADGKVYRVDPAADTYDVVVDAPDHSFDGITFSPDYDTLYFNEELGDVHQAPVNPDGTLGPDTVLVNVFDVLDDTGDFLAMSLLDGMTADICGNIYVVIMSGIIARITPSGEAEVAVLVGDSDDGTSMDFIPAVNFGSGYGGWKKDHLYVMSFSQGIYEVDMGVEGKPEPHL